MPQIDKITFFSIIFWITILYIFQYLLLSIFHLYIFVSSFKLKIKRIIFNLFLNRIISRQLLSPFILLSWTPLTPSHQLINKLIYEHNVLAYQVKQLIFFLVLLNIIYIINFYVQHSQNRPKHSSKIERKRWYKMVCWTILFIFLLCLTMVLFHHYVPLFKMQTYPNDGNLVHFYAYINSLVSGYYCWMGCLVSLLVLIFFVSWLTGVKLRPGKSQSDDPDYFRGTGF